MIGSAEVEGPVDRTLTGKARPWRADRKDYRAVLAHGRAGRRAGVCSFRENSRLERHLPYARPRRSGRRGAGGSRARNRDGFTAKTFDLSALRGPRPRAAGDDPVGRKVRSRLDLPRGPADLDAVDPVGPAEPEVGRGGRATRGSCRRRRSSGRSVRPPAAAVTRARSRRCSAAGRAGRSERRSAPAPDSFQRTTLGAWWWTITRSISPSPSRSPAARPRPWCSVNEVGAGRRRHVRESAVPGVPPEDRRVLVAVGLGGLAADVAVRHDEVEVAVLVEVGAGGAPAGDRAAVDAEAGGVGPSRKNGPAGARPGRARGCRARRRSA